MSALTAKAYFVKIDMAKKDSVACPPQIENTQFNFQMTTFRKILPIYYLSILPVDVSIFWYVPSSLENLEMHLNQAQ